MSLLDIPAGAHVLGFDFYGSGNIGDDIMLGGFTAALPGVRLMGHCQNLASQRHRFPEILWLDPANPESGALQRRCMELGGAWLGVGDTPFQISSGPWFLRKLLSAAESLDSKTPMLLVGVGAERGVAQFASTLRPVFDRIDHVWARDAKSAQLLVDWGVSAARVEAGADLAHAFLGERQHRPEEPRPFPLGLNFYSERRLPRSEAALRAFARDRAVKPLRLIATDGRPGMEAAFFSRLVRPSVWARLGGAMPADPSSISLPRYEAATLDELVEPFAEIEVLLSSRYHAIVCAAWSGCRVGVLGGRSSKLDDLAEEMNLPIIKPPYSLRSLTKLYEKAASVGSERLQSAQRVAEQSARDAMKHAAKI